MEHLPELSYLQSVLPILVAIIVATIVFQILNKTLKTSNFTRRLKKISNYANDDENYKIDTLLNKINIFFSPFFKFLAKNTILFNSATQNLSKRFLKAGIRNRNARIYYIFSKLVPPITIVIGAYFFLSNIPALESNQSIHWVVTVLSFLIMFSLPDIYLRNRARSRRANIEKNWQDVLDLMVICIESGLSVEASLRRVTTELSYNAPILASELALTLAETSIMPDRRRAYANLAERTDLRNVRATTIALIQADRHGASIASSLRAISVSNREVRMANIERQYSSLGPKLTIPLVIFFMPVIFVILLNPVILNGLPI